MKKQYDWSKAKRGPLEPLPPGKQRITIRLDRKVLDWFRRQVNLAGGGDYQTMINDVLKEHIARRKNPPEEAFRRVIQEELPMVREMLLEWKSRSRPAPEAEGKRKAPRLRK